MQTTRRERIHEIIFGAYTPAGKAFDIVLLVIILASVAAVMLESVEYYSIKYGTALRVIEWIFTILFTIEYGLRIYAVRKPARYIFSFFGIIDFLAIVPTYLSVFVLSGVEGLVVIRALRLLRVFRVLKLARFLGEARQLQRAMRNSRVKIIVFLITVLTLDVIIGAVMYLVEGADAGFTSIPKSMYWAIVTMTTVGYGDIAPITPLGQFLASIVMIIGYGIIAVPTGIVTAEITRASAPMQVTNFACPACGSEGHANDARHCKYCGDHLHREGLSRD